MSVNDVLLASIAMFLTSLAEQAARQTSAIDKNAPIESRPNSPTARIQSAFENLSRQKQVLIKTTGQSPTGPIEHSIYAKLPAHFRVVYALPEASEMIFTPDGTVARSLAAAAGTSTSWLPVQMGTEAMSTRFTASHFRSEFSKITHAKALGAGTCHGEKSWRFRFQSLRENRKVLSTLHITQATNLPCELVAAETISNKRYQTNVHYTYDEQFEIALP
jgi:hypothetical protein